VKGTGTVIGIVTEIVTEIVREIVIEIATEIETETGAARIEIVIGIVIETAEARGSVSRLSRRRRRMRDGSPFHEH
jgi:CO/xanthine dehydrogenase FAD-binding subunit